ncbi:hypothetical protein GJ744_009755 [Endocarpon pusillum]|uniref:Uncharacterized protein n=1 Tax=Endocarpon pusillum TaxID=364733 RepID=A0A8H7ATN2_9EURO|nr:hypothetical protein GJ744_009755 [Endocarpon pusillum]
MNVYFPVLTSNECQSILRHEAEPFPTMNHSSGVYQLLLQLPQETQTGHAERDNRCFDLRLAQSPAAAVVALHMVRGAPMGA